MIKSLNIYTNYVLYLLKFVLITTIYQNCDYPIKSSDINFKTKEVVFTSTLANADITWNLANTLQFLTFNEYHRVEHWISTSNLLIPLYPEYIPYSTFIDLDHSAQFINTTKGPRLRFEEGTSLTSIIQNFNQLASDKYSLLFEINNIVFPIEEPKVIRLFSLTPNDLELESGSLYLDLIDEGDFIVVKAEHHISIKDYAYKTIQITKDKVSSGLGIAVSWTSEPGDIEIAVNGELSSNPPERSGSTNHFLFTGRKLSVKSPYILNKGRFDLAEIGLFKRNLTLTELKEYSLGILRTYELNQASIISTINGLNIEGNSTSPNFRSIQNLFEKSFGSQSCTTCHDAFSSRSTLLAANSNGINWVIPGEPNQSLIIQSLRHLEGAKSMPIDGNRMDEADIQLIEKWIQHGAL